MTRDPFGVRLELRGLSPARPPALYRLPGGRVYHYAARDWVRSGRALCGRPLHSPAALAPDAGAVGRAGYRVCQSCAEALEAESSS